MVREGRATAHAKVNLELRVLARESGGYHAIETVFQRLEIGDDVLVRADVTGRSLDCAGPEMPRDGLGSVERNLAWRAASVYAEATGWPSGFAIEVVKRVPVGGGLGGGSADAGAVLRILDALSPRPLGDRQLVALAAPLGSDVPFLASEAVHALAWSRGERLLSLPALPIREAALIFPPFSTATAEAYERLATARTAGWSPAGSLSDPAELGEWAGADARAHNDFEDVVGAWHPELHGCVGWLRDRGARIAMLAGSGSTVYGLFEEGGAPAPDARPPVGRLLLTRTLSRVVAVERDG
jgi:4-diphosphocytidyl-2-C-methyl-D-erythritol kinase